MLSVKDRVELEEMIIVQEALIKKQAQRIKVLREGCENGMYAFMAMGNVAKSIGLPQDPLDLVKMCRKHAQEMQDALAQAKIIAEGES